MNFALIRQQIENLKLQYPDLQDDEDAWLISIESETDTFELLRRLETRRQEAEYLQEAIALNISAMNERKVRMTRRDEAMRKLMLLVMEAADMRKVELPEATISVRAGSERLVINDEASVPKELCQVKYVPDKTLIKKLLKYGQQFNWCAIVTGEPTVAIRTK